MNFKELVTAANSVLNDLADLIRDRAVNQLLVFCAVVLSVVVGFLYQEKYSLPFYPYSCIVASAINLFCIGILAERLFRRTTPFSSRTSAEPTSIKGDLPFSIENGELFWQLERNDEIGKFLDRILDNNSAAIVTVSGPRCVGISSFLQAGGQYHLKKRLDIKCAYCEATTSDFANALRHAVNIQTGIDLGDNLTAISAANSRLIIIIDQFERLDPCGADIKPLIDFLKSVISQHKPYLIQVVVAYQADYNPLWEKMGIKAQQKLSLDPLLSKAAIKAMDVILSHDNVQVDRAILNEYVNNVSRGGYVLPIDIGIGCQVLFNRARITNRRYISFQTYRMAGGTSGIWSEYIRDWIIQSRRFDQSRHREILLWLLQGGTETHGKIILDSSSSKYAAQEGKACQITLSDYEIAELTKPCARILEQHNGDSGNIYKLSNSYLEKALRHITREIPSDFALLPNSAFLAEQYGWWEITEDKRHLLKGKDLTNAVNFVAATKADARLVEYVKRSKRFRNRRICFLTISVALVSLIAWYGFQFADVQVQRAQLRSWGLPPDLYEAQARIQGIETNGPPITELEWLQSGSLANVGITSVEASDLLSLHGIASLPKIQSLTLDLTGSAVDDLRQLGELDELSDLTLMLGKSGVKNLRPLAQLPKLHKLTLFIRGSQVRDLAALAKISHLDDLTLNLDEAQSGMLTALENAEALQNLILNVTGSANEAEPEAAEDLLKKAEKANHSVLSAVTRLKQLQQLTIRLQDSNMQRLPEIGRLGRLKLLALHLGGSPVQVLPDLKHLNELESLTLDLDGSPIKKVQDLSSLPHLKNISVILNGAQVDQIPPLTGATSSFQSAPSALQAPLESLLLDSDASHLIDLGGKQFESLQSLEYHVDALNLAQLPKLLNLKKLRCLTLHLSWEHIQSLPDFSQQDNPSSITLYLDGDIDSKTNFDYLKKVQNLTLYIAGSQAHNLPALKGFTHLKSLSLNLQRSHIERLPEFSGFDDLQTLLLNLESSQIQDLTSLQQIKSNQLQKVTINIRSTHISKLPTLKQTNNPQVTLDIRGSEIRDLSQVGTIGNVQEIILDRQVHSLAGIPDSVKTIRFLWYNQNHEQISTQCLDK